MWEYSCHIHTQLCSLLSIHVQTTTCQPINNLHSHAIEYYICCNYSKSFDIVNIYPEHVMDWPHVNAAALAHD
jgi:hypothetical protein